MEAHGSLSRGAAFPPRPRRIKTHVLNRRNLPGWGVGVTPSRGGNRFQWPVGHWFPGKIQKYSSLGQGVQAPTCIAGPIPSLGVTNVFFFIPPLGVTNVFFLSLPWASLTSFFLSLPWASLSSLFFCPPWASLSSFFFALPGTRGSIPQPHIGTPLRGDPNVWCPYGD